MEKNFRFLKENYPSLYENACIGINNAYADSDTCIYKIRKMSENIVEIVFCKERLEIDSKRTHFENINILCDKGIIRGEYLDYLHELRLTANRTVHQGEAGTAKAMRCLWLIHKLCNWLYKKYDCPNHQEHSFQYRLYKQEISEGTPHINDQDKEFFQMVMRILYERVLEIILNDKREKGMSYLSVLDIPRLTFFEFYNYFLQTLDFMANWRIEEGSGLILIMNLRRTARQALSTTDDLTVNKELALMLYSKTNWGE